MVLPEARNPTSAHTYTIMVLEGLRAREKNRRYDRLLARGHSRVVLISMDHLVILVRDLDRAVGGYGSLGFEVTPGGEHADGLTRNALIPFEDGSYIELVAFVDPEDPRDNVWGWRPFLRRGGGLIDYCAASGDLGAEVRRLEGCGFDVEGPTEGGRRLPDR